LVAAVGSIGVIAPIAAAGRGGSSCRTFPNDSADAAVRQGPDRVGARLGSLVAVTVVGSCV